MNPALWHITVLTMREEQSLRTILVTSPNPREGKSLVVANLAAALAQRELRVIVVDADLRLPRQHTLFRLDLGQGMTAALENGLAKDYLQQVGTEGLKVLTSGELPSNPAVAVASKRMPELLQELVGDADLVLVDCPPVLPVADATILASIVDCVLLVVRADHTHRQELRNAVESLYKVNDNLLGVVLNGVSSRGDRYYQYYSGENGYTPHRKPRWKKSTWGPLKLFGDDGAPEKINWIAESGSKRSNKTLQKLVELFKDRG